MPPFSRIWPGRRKIRGAETVTVALQVPPAPPVTVSVKVVLIVGATIVEPAAIGDTDPTLLSMLPELASDVVHDSCDVAPASIELGLAESEHDASEGVS